MAVLKKTKAGLPEKLVFKSGEAFLEYQCKFGHTKIVPKQGIVAVVLDAQKEFGAASPVKVESDGCQKVTLKVASEDGGFVVSSQTPTGKGDRLKPGDVVIWVPLEHMNMGADQSILAAADLDSRFGWIGFVVAKVKPELDISKPDLDIVSRYD